MSSDRCCFSDGPLWAGGYQLTDWGQLRTAGGQRPNLVAEALVAAGWFEQNTAYYHPVVCGVGEVATAAVDWRGAVSWLPRFECVLGRCQRLNEQDEYAVCPLIALV